MLDLLPLLRVLDVPNLLPLYGFAYLLKDHAFFVNVAFKGQSYHFPVVNVNVNVYVVKPFLEACFIVDDFLFSNYFLKSFRMRMAHAS